MPQMGIRRRSLYLCHTPSSVSTSVTFMFFFSVLSVVSQTPPVQPETTHTHTHTSEATFSEKLDVIGRSCYPLTHPYERPHTDLLMRSSSSSDHSHFSDLNDIHAFLNSPAVFSFLPPARLFPLLHKPETHTHTHKHTHT